jgi:hypothetical protein
MNDFAGKVINLNDTVAFVHPLHRGLTKGKVLAFTPEKVRVSYLRWFNWKEESTTLKPPCEVIVL